MLSPHYTTALTIAAELHADQLRKGSAIPYLSHLLSVSALVLEYGGDEEQAIAALLHDAIEDQAHQYGGAKQLRQRIAQRFGLRVLRIVDACTDSDQEPKPPWQERKQRYLAHLPQTSQDALLIVAADKLHNAQTMVMDYRQIGERLWERFNGGRAGSLWYYRALADQLQDCFPHPITSELARTVTLFEQLSMR